MEVTQETKKTRGRPKLSEEERKRRVKERNDFYYGKIKEAMKLAKLNTLEVIPIDVA